MKGLDLIKLVSRFLADLSEFLLTILSYCVMLE